MPASESRCLGGVGINDCLRTGSRRQSVLRVEIVESDERFVKPSKSDTKHQADSDTGWTSCGDQDRFIAYLKTSGAMPEGVAKFRQCQET